MKKELDYEGMLLCSYQGKLFEKSYDLNCSSAIFLRRFINSHLLDEIDLNTTINKTLDEDEGIASIISQFGPIDYGKNKYSKESLFWMGYIYRYISYTRDISTRTLFSLFHHELLNAIYYPYHSQDPEVVVQYLLKINGLQEDDLDKNNRFKFYLLKLNKDNSSSSQRK